MFDENVIYYEDPKTKVNSIDVVKKIWAEIKLQNTNNIELNILCTNEYKCIVNFILNDQILYDMIYEIELNEENK